MAKLSLVLVIICTFSPFYAWAQGGSVPIETSAPVEATSAARTVAPTVTPVPTPRPTPPSTPVTSSGPVVMPTISAELVSSPDLETENSAGINFSIVGLIVLAAACVLGFFGIKISKKGQQAKQENGRCDSIRDLLEQKKKELEEFVRNWPEEKIKSLAQQKIIGELKKNDDAKKIIETAESLKAKHDKLKETIEMLQKRYDLCVLELPSLGKEIYKGTIVENSLKDKTILEKLKVTKKYPIEDWMLHDLEIDREKIDRLGRYMADGPWYMHFWQKEKDEVIIVFKEKSFKIKYSDKSTWVEAIEYGKAKGIPEEQLDFTIH